MGGIQQPGTLAIQSVSPAATVIGSMALGAAPGTLRFTATGVLGQTNFQYVAADVSNPARFSTGTVTLVVEGRNDAPEIHNATTNAPITDKESALVFTGVTLVEHDQQLQELIDVTVAVDDPAKGVLTNLQGFVDLGGGVYQASNVTAAVATEALRLLAFVNTQALR